MKWIVPQNTTSTSVDPITDVAPWPGLGTGTSSFYDLLLQAGTESVSQGSKREYQFWYQGYPAQGHACLLTKYEPHPGDTVQVQITLTKDIEANHIVALYSLGDITTDHFYNFSVTYPGSDSGGSAEWIVERPQDGTDPNNENKYQLAQFKTVPVSMLQYRIKGVVHSCIGDPDYQNTRFDMQLNGKLLAHARWDDTNGCKFTVTHDAS